MVLHRTTTHKMLNINVIKITVCKNQRVYDG